ncbi:MAG: glycosyltransferase family 2 protein [Desulfuromonadaceae bacterium]|nr:glycosyltransferase family 2 protein [Desulfuromonadaceae bacterium]
MSRAIIILVNWNGWQDTVECLESLQDLAYPDFRIVVCDNGSSDNSLHEIKHWANRHEMRHVELQRADAEAGRIPYNDSKLTLIRSDENLGFAGGCNVGLRYAQGRGDADYCWLLNNDTVVEPDALTHLVARIRLQPKMGMCGSTILLYHDRRRIQALGGGHYCRWIGLPWHYGRFTRWSRKIDPQRAEAWMNYVEGASMLVSKKFIDDVGLLSEDYFLYFEEADWAIRADGRFKLGYAPRSIVYHKVGGSVGTSSNPARMSYTSDYYNIRNRLMFTRRFYPAAETTVRLVIVGAFLLRLFLGKWDRAAMIFRLLFNRADRPRGILSGNRSKP